MRALEAKGLSVWSQLPGMLALTLTLTLGGCGGAQPAPQTASDSGGLNWAAGAPSVSPAYTPEERVTLSMCPMISRTVFMAFEYKKEGIPLDKAIDELTDPPAELVDRPDERNEEMLRQFIQATYEKESDDGVANVVKDNSTCAEQLSELTGPRAERAVFCLNRVFAATAAHHWKDELDLAAVTERVWDVPGRGAAFMKSSHQGRMPTLADFQQCAFQ